MAEGEKGDLSSGGRAKMLTETGEPYAEPDPSGVGMLGLFATEFRVMWETGGYTTHFTFEEARAKVRDNQWGQAVQIERIETIWVRSHDAELCGARHPDAEEDPKHYGTPCDYPKGHDKIEYAEGEYVTTWDHGYRFEGEPACLWTGYLGEPREPEPERVNICCGHATCQRLIREAIEEAVQAALEERARITGTADIEGPGDVLARLRRMGEGIVEGSILDDVDGDLAEQEEIVLARAEPRCPRTKFPDGTRCGDYGWHAKGCYLWTDDEDRSPLQDGERDVKYPVGITPEEYAAMEDGYEQGRDSVKWPDTSALRGLTSAGAVRLVVDGVAYVRQADLIAAIDEMGQEHQVKHEEIVAALHRAHLEHNGDDPDVVEDCGQCAMYAEWVAPLLGDARAAGVVEQLDRDAAPVAEAERRVRRSVWHYCEVAAQTAEENPGNPYAVGLAKGYRDLQEKIAPAMGEVT